MQHSPIKWLGLTTAALVALSAGPSAAKVDCAVLGNRIGKASTVSLTNNCTEPVTFILITNRGTHVLNVPALASSVTVTPHVVRWRACYGVSTVDC